MNIELSCERADDPYERCCKKCHDRGHLKISKTSINGKEYSCRHCCNYELHINTKDGQVTISLDYVDAVNISTKRVD